jgi:hypothetical protein
VAGELIGEGQGDPQKNQHDDPRLLLSPQKPKNQNGKNVGEILEVGHEWHKPVEKRILALPIYQVEKDNVHRFQKGYHIHCSLLFLKSMH